jgi:hypothetical protein
MVILNFYLFLFSTNPPLSHLERLKMYSFVNYVDHCGF